MKEYENPNITFNQDLKKKLGQLNKGMRSGIVLALEKNLRKKKRIKIQLRKILTLENLKKLMYLKAWLKIV
jgi:hypothetical protein